MTGKIWWNRRQNGKKMKFLYFQTLALVCKFLIIHILILYVYCLTFFLQFSFFYLIYSLVDIIGIKPAPGDFESNFEKVGAIPYGCNTKWTVSNISNSIFWYLLGEILWKIDPRIVMGLFRLICEVKGAYWISSNSSFIQYCDSNIILFSIAPHLVIALPTLR